MKRHTKTNVLLGITLFSLPAIAMAQSADTLSLNRSEMVNVAFQKKNINDVLGGVSVIDYNALTKKNYNTYALDNLQGYIGGWNGACMWGSGDYLTIVDGVPRDADLLPSEIDQITFLKSAAAVVLYGSRAAKGAIIITTKRGKIGDLRISARGDVGMNVAKRYPKYLGSAEYMTLYNEARANDGLSALYSDDDIYNYGSGINKYRYPNLDYYSSDYIRKTYMREDGNVEITGGASKARFYANLGIYHTNDVFNFGKAKDNGTTKLNFRGNVDINISDMISAFARANVTFYDVKTANGSSSYWLEASKMRPNRLSPLIPTNFIDPNNTDAMSFINNSQNIIDGQYFLSGTKIDQTNAIADMYASGHGTWTSRQFQFDAGMNMNLDRVLKGLSFMTQFSVDYTSSYSSTYTNTYATYTPSWANYNGMDEITSLSKINNDKKTGVQAISGSATAQTIFFSSQFNYKNTFAQLHHLNAMFIGSGWQKSVAGNYHRTSNVNLALEADYDYAQKYYAQFGAALIHSAKLSEGKRDGLSPSLQLGWKLKNESFLSDVNFIDELTLSASASELKTDLDISDYYMYSANYDQNNGSWWGWRDGVSEHSTNSKRGENNALTFIKRKEYSVNLKTALFNRLITAEFSYFHDNYDGGIIKPNTLMPNYFTTYYPEASFIYYMNYNKETRKGFDFSMNFNKKLGDIDWSLGVNGTYYTTEAKRRDEKYQDAYQNRVGRPVDALWGYRSAGFYKDADDIANSPKSQLGDVKPGDIKYIDQNGDNIIDSKDEVYLGKGGWSGSPFTLGVNLTAKWKCFTFFALCTGGWGAYAYKNNSYWWVYGDGKYSEVVRGRWTAETAETATYPRLTTGSNNNNFCNSDFWLYSTDRFDLSKIQVTYDLPTKLFKNTFIHGISVYVSGNSLLTLSGERKQLEMNVGASPQYRYYNLGAKVDF